MKSDELTRKYGDWDNDRLLQALTRDAEQYLPEALAVMRQVLAARGVAAAEIEERSAEALLARQRGDQTLTGIRGFLLVFIVLFAFWSLALFAQAYGELMAIPPDNPLRLVVLVMGLLAVYGLYCTVQLIRKSATAVWHTNTCMTLWFVFWVGNLVFQLVATGTYAGGGFPLAWAVYLTSSKRVANTYNTGSKKASNIAGSVSPT